MPIAYVYAPSFATITNHIYVKYNYPMTKVYWLAAGGFLIPNSIRLVYDENRWRRILQHFLANGLKNAQKSYMQKTLEKVQNKNNSKFD